MKWFFLQLGKALGGCGSSPTINLLLFRLWLGGLGLLNWEEEDAWMFLSWQKQEEVREIMWGRALITDVEIA